jgi:PucR family transcriptional regulator, purine catabolism regulatory protein
MCTVSVTLREILDLDPLQRASAKVLAGEGQLDRSVRWVHISELPDIAYLLRGGELLLTTGMGIAGSGEVQRRYIAELVAAGAVGLVIELGRNFRVIPPTMVKAAEENGLPLIALEREIPYVEVTEAVHRAIINRQYELLSRAENVSRELTELILSGAEVGQVVARLAEIFGNLVVLEDEAHQVVEIAGRRSSIGTVLSSWDEHSRASHDEGGRGTVHRYDGVPACLWVGLWLRNSPWGRLHVLETNERFRRNL